MSAPDRLIAWPAKSMYQGVSLAGGPPDKMVEYVRADLCAPMQDERVKRLVEALINEAVSMADDNDEKAYVEKRLRTALRDLGEG